MKYGQISFMTMAMLFMAGEAWANPGPNSTSFLFIFGFPFSLLIFSSIGGVYELPKEIRSNEINEKKIATNTLILFACFIFSMLMYFLPYLISLILGFISLIRGVRMIIWGARVKSENASSSRLISSGLLLILFTLVFSAITVLDFNSYQSSFNFTNGSGSQLHRAYRTAQVYFKKNPNGVITEKVLAQEGFEAWGGRIVIEAGRKDNLMIKILPDWTGWYKKEGRRINAKGEIVTARKFLKSQTTNSESQINSKLQTPNHK
ncbi:hypothetical protein QUF80_01895 [Desulfococcaceae bacterium HSG8]|nr:hypothetical protein [Desulfococcaceae bacterium HSG8]